MNEIIIIGLGPGAFSLLTMETWDILRTATNLRLRTAKHPTVPELEKRGIQYSSYDHIYDRRASFEEVYNAIAQAVADEAETKGEIVYAVPGSPLVAERTVALIRHEAAKRNIAVRIVPGMSFLELLYTRLTVDPIDGLTVVDAAAIEQLPCDLNTGLVVTQVYNRQVASDAKLSLMELYPDDYRVTVVQNLSLPDERIQDIALYELDRLPGIDHLTSVYVPPLSSKGKVFSIDPLVEVMAKLRSPEGCLWDIEQTHQSLRRYMVEEVYEALEAIDNEDSAGLCEELGDLLLQIVFHARVAEEAGAFSMQDVVNEVTDKMIRRHPHVFGDISVRSATEVVVNWEAIKKREKGERKSVLDGVSPGLPSLMRAFKLQAKAAKVGFDWDNIGPVWDKLEEEWQEMKEAARQGDKEALEGELGDFLFAAVNLARFLNIEPETALNRTNNKFVRRFSYIEDKVTQANLRWQDLTLEQLDVWWNEVKAKETKKQ